MTHTISPARQTDYLRTARRLAELISQEAIIVDRPAQLSPAVAAALYESGLYWAMTPEEQGGGGIDIVGAIDLIEEIARADGATGWVYMVHLHAAATTAVTVGQQAINEMYGGDRPPVISGVLAPTGTAVPADGGFRVTGKYSFGSGIDQAEWMHCGALVKVDGDVELTDDGSPRHVAVCTPITTVKKLGNWNTYGLQATGSLDYAIDNAFVPTDFVHEMPNPKPLRGLPFFNVGLQVMTATGHSAVALGIAKRALEEIAELAVARKRPGSAAVADQQLFQYEFSFNDAAVRAARAYVVESCRATVASTNSGETVTAEEIQRVRQACTYTHRVAVDAIRFAYGWSGTTGLRRPSALGNCLVDISGATQHKYVDPNTLIDAAPVLLEAARPRSRKDSNQAAEPVAVGSAVTGARNAAA